MRVSASFKDPSGFVFTKNGKLYRQVNKRYKTKYLRLFESGLYTKLTKNKLLIPHKEMSMNLKSTQDAYKIISPQKIPFISYPYEWCFSQLKDAALLTLKIQKEALTHNMTLKDASAYNIQFLRGKPILIDTLSFDLYEEGKPWVAYKQFCQHFLNPIVLMSKVDPSLNSLMRLHIDGIPTALIGKFLPKSTYLNLKILLHIHLHSMGQKKLAGKTPIKTPLYTMNSQVALIQSLQSLIQSLRLKEKDTLWSNYYADTNYTKRAFSHKKRVVEKMLNNVTQKRVVLDLGSNTGIFSKLDLLTKSFVVSSDLDSLAVEANYLDCKNRDLTNILPLVIDQTNPSPAIGWDNSERDSFTKRSSADVVIALALIHHLVISNNLTFSMVSDHLAKLGKALIIEFVPKTDSNVIKMLKVRDDIFQDYNAENFEKEFKKNFVIKKKVKIRGSERVIYLMLKK